VRRGAFIAGSSFPAYVAIVVRSEPSNGAVFDRNRGDAKMRQILPPSALVLAAVLAGGLPDTAVAAELVLELDPRATTVSFDVPATGHDVHGAFVVDHGSIRFDPTTGAASGEIVLDAASAATGNDGRDKTLRGQVLEAARFPSIVFRARRLDGTVPENGSAELTLHGELDLHGGPHAVDLPAHIEVAGGAVKGTTRLTVPWKAWGLHDPSIVFLRVAPEVVVDIALAGRIETVAAEPAPEATASATGAQGGGGNR
jgi:polyisoprenoid-binding protein YceI